MFLSSLVSHTLPLFSTLLIVSLTIPFLPCYQLILDHPLCLQSRSVADPLVKLGCLFKTQASFQLHTQCFLFFSPAPPPQNKSPRKCKNVTGCTLLLYFHSSGFFWVCFFQALAKYEGIVNIIHCHGMTAQGKSSIFLRILGARWSLAHSWVRGCMECIFFMKTHWGISWYIIIKSRAGSDLQRSPSWLKPRSVYN